MVLPTLAEGSPGVINESVVSQPSCDYNSIGWVFGDERQGRDAGEGKGRASSRRYDRGSRLIPKAAGIS